MPDPVSRVAGFAIAAGVFALDRASKWLIETRFSPFDTRHVIPGFFDLVRSQNPGVAFGIFSESTLHYRTALLAGLSLIAVAVLAWMLWRIQKMERKVAIGLALIFGGALGNVFDRVCFGTVTDFLDFYIGTAHWYTFNLADTAICIGAGLLLLDMLRPSPRTSASYF